MLSIVTGNPRNLVGFVRPADEPAGLIHQAAKTLANCAAIAANAIVDATALDTAN